MIRSGGYYLTRTVERPPYVSAELLPGRILSFSECICDFVPAIWVIEWAGIGAQERIAEAAKFGLSEEELGEAITWVTSSLEARKIGWPGVFFSVREAREFASRFLGNQRDVRLFGIGMRDEQAEKLIEECRTDPSEAASGAIDAVASGVGLEPGGIELGWEILCYDFGGFHSWLCNGLEVAVFERLGIRPAPNGFIASAEEAQRAASYCGSGEVGAEPGFWGAWLVMEYPISAESR